MWKRHLLTIEEQDAPGVAWPDFWYGGGGGGKAPQMYRQKKDSLHVTYMRERAPHKYIYLFRSQNTCYINIHMQSMLFHFLTYGMALLTTAYQHNTNIEQIYEYASE